MRARLPHPGIAIDLPGHGNCTTPVRGFEHAVRDLLTQLPGEVDRLVGYSMGGRFALGLIAQAPWRFRSATLISTHPGLEHDSARQARQASDAAWATQLRTQGLTAFVEAWSDQPLFASQQRLPAAIREGQRLTRLAQNAEALADSLLQHGLGAMPNLWNALTRFPGELHWIVGELDTKFVAIAHEVTRRRTQTRLRIIPDVGHNPVLECPEALACALGAETALEAPEQRHLTLAQATGGYRRRT